jgi:carboxyl-terminal processing protease
MEQNKTWLWMVRAVMCVGVSLVFTYFSPCYCATGAEADEEIQSKVTREVDYTMDSEAEYDVRAGTALKLNFGSNPFDIGSMILYVDRMDGSLWEYLFDRTGKRVRGGGSSIRSQIGSIRGRRVGERAAAIVARWQPTNDSVHVRFIVSTDKARNTREMEALIAGRRFGKGWDDFPRFPLRISQTDRVAGFVRFWSEAKQNFAFFERMPDLNWDKVLVDYLPRIEKAETLNEYGSIMRECAALLRDGHTEYYGVHDEDFSDCPPIRICGISGKAIIAEVDPDSVADPGAKSMLLKANLTPGEEIVKVDGVAVRERLEKGIYPHVCASTPQARDLRAYLDLLRGVYESQVTLTVKDAAGSLREVKLKCTGGVPWPENEFTFKKIGDIGYVNLPSFGNASTADEFDKLAAQLQGLKGLIIDVRRNGGGDDPVGERIISHLINTPLKTTIWRTRQYRPSFRAWGEKEGWHKGDPGEVKPSEKKYFLGPIVVLTSAQTCSAAEDFTVALHAGKRVTIVGERTNGSTGQPLFIDLPMGARARICTKWDSYPDGREFVGVGVIPDVEIGPTPEDIAKGRDAVLDKGVEVLKGMMGGTSK